MSFVPERASFQRSPSPHVRQRTWTCLQSALSVLWTAFSPVETISGSSPRCAWPLGPCGASPSPSRPTPEEVHGLHEGQEVALYDKAETLIGMLHLQDIFPYEKRLEAQTVYGTTEEAHPGIAALYRQGDVLLGGPVTVIQRQDLGELAPYRRDPAETRAIFHEHGWRTIVGFQTRNPVHRAHEYIQKSALETVGRPPSAPSRGRHQVR